MAIDTSAWRELSVDEHKQRALNILLEVASFCDENNIRYFLAYGTLIGAIRHKGLYLGMMMSISRCQDLIMSDLRPFLIRDRIVIISLQLCQPIRLQSIPS